MQNDLLFKNENLIFSYRTTGILKYNNQILFQKPKNESGLSLPGGHVMSMEFSQDALKREFKEELGIHINIDSLCAVGEIYFSWNERPCHQLNLYYLVSISDEEYNSFFTKEKLYAKDSAGKDRFDLEFVWIPIKKIAETTIYPQEIKTLLSNSSHSFMHFTSVQL